LGKNGEEVRTSKKNLEREVLLLLFGSQRKTRGGRDHREKAMPRGGGGGENIRSVMIPRIIRRIAKGSEGVPEGKVLILTGRGPVSCGMPACTGLAGGRREKTGYFQEGSFLYSQTIGAWNIRRRKKKCSKSEGGEANDLRGNNEKVLSFL